MIEHPSKIAPKSKPPTSTSKSSQSAASTHTFNSLSTATSTMSLPESVNTSQTGTATPANTDTPPKLMNFPKLPAELRLEIWKLVQTPRLVEVRFIRDGRKHQHRFIADIPILLHICRESRLEGLKSYKLSFGTKYAMNKVYFDNKIDTLSISDHACVNQTSHFVHRDWSGDLARLERLAVGSRDFRRLLYSYGKQGRQLPFPKLKEVLILHYAWHSGDPCVENRLYVTELDDLIARHIDNATYLSRIQATVDATKVKLSMLQEELRDIAGKDPEWKMPVFFLKGVGIKGPQWFV